MTQAASAGAIVDADSTRARHLREHLRGQAVAYSITLGSVAALLAGAYLHSVLLIAAGPLAVVAIAVVIAFVTAGRESEADFFRAYASAHGFTITDRTELLPLTPLLGAGDERHCEQYMEGPLSERGISCGLGHYTFEIQRDRESGAGRHETHDFTICVADLEQGISMFPGIFLTRRRGLFGFIDGEQWLSHVNRRKVELESAELCEHYDLYVDEAQDELQLRELFAPSFVLWLAQHPLAPCFEYRAGTLVVYVERKLEDAGHLDWMLAAAAEIAARFAHEIEERRAPAGIR
jgi:hypothetical protein